MSDLQGMVLEMLRDQVRDRRLRVAVLCRRPSPLVSAVAAAGHRTVVVSDRFRALFSIQQRLGRAAGERSVLAEARFDELPLGPRSFDALLLAHGLPRLGAPADALGLLRALLVPGGLLLWVQVSTEGIGGMLARIASPLRSRAVLPVARRHHLCAWTMNAGFCEIGQFTIRGRPAPLVLTSAVAAREPVAP